MAEIINLTFYRRFWSLRELGVILAICHFIFFLSVVVRTLATVFSNLGLALSWEVIVDVSPLLMKLSHVCCICIWLSGTYMACFLILEIVKNELLRTVSINFKWCDMAKIGAVLALILYYEVWMFSYIYKTYVTALKWEFRIVMLAPFTTVLIHTTLQMVLIPYLNCIRSCNATQYSYFKHYINSSLFFNATMILHVVCMGIISCAQGSMKKADTPFMLFFGIVEFFYRCYATYKHYNLRSIHYHARQGIAVHESINPNAIHPDRSYHGMVVTGMTFLFAFFVCAYGVAMAIDETNINS